MKLRINSDWVVAIIIWSFIFGFSLWVYFAPEEYIFPIQANPFFIDLTA